MYFIEDWILEKEVPELSIFLSSQVELMTILKEAPVHLL